jgi:hypothetical protein
MITWHPVSKFPDPGTTVWAMDQEYAIGLAIFNGVDKYMHQSGQDFIGIKWWAKFEEINLPGMRGNPIS